MAKLMVNEFVERTRKIEYAPCLKCGSNDIQFFDYGYTQGNSGGGKCKKCGNECTSPLHWDAKVDAQVAAWNAKNDVPQLIADQEKIIADAKVKIEEIRAHQAALVEKSTT